MTTPIVGSPEWLALRMTGIGASEAAAACGVSRYATPLHVYMRKRGLLSDIEDNDAMRMGRRLEPVVLSEFIERSGEEVAEYPVPTMRHPIYDCILATPDARLKSGSLLECKTTSWRMAQELGEEGSDYIPTEWLMQCQQQMAVAGVDLCHLAVLLDGRTLRTYQVRRHEKIIAQIVQVELELWEKIDAGVAPLPNFEHEATAELLRSIHGVKTGKIIELPEDLAAEWERQKAMGQQISALQEEREAVRSKVLHAIGDAAIARLPGGVREIARKQIPEKAISFVKKPYVHITERKVKE